MDLTVLSDDELVAKLKALCGEEDRILARIISYLVEVDERRLHLKSAHPSLYDFCRNRLGMTESEAY
jgi:hypothetical protein